ncbi:hypothetical protein ECANGB1_420 [Enterospora canceri]|uniref:Uncharacterized protein n=1 Tax=Enterospora canceri TaxID=1081671 RepID=A0A1Y1S4E7_9MICR|nr:hypothetical protein ECANGB1_420 [Enterospora canceri]
MSYDSKLVDLLDEYFLIDSKSVEIWFKKVVIAVKQSDLDAERHSKAFGIIRLMLMNENDKIVSYGKILSYLIYKEDRFGAKNLKEYAEIVDNNISVTEEQGCKNKTDEFYVKKKIGTFYIQQAHRKLISFELNVEEKLGVWLDLRNIASRSSRRALDHYSGKIVRLFRDDEVKLELFERLIDSNMLQKYTEIQNIRRIEDKRDQVECKIKNSLDVKFVGLVGLLIILAEKDCINTLNEITSLIFESSEPFNSNIFKYYLIEAVIFLILETRELNAKYDIYNGILKHVNRIQDCNLNKQSFTKLKELFEIIKLLG